MLIFIFCIGYALIVFEHQVKLNKTASALMTGVLCWTWFVFSGDGSAAHTDGVLHQLSEVLSKSSEIVFFLLGAMTIVELMDAHNGFELITNRITTTNRRKLLWIVALITFFLASVLDTLATIVVVIKLLDKLLDDDEEKLTMSGFAVVAANAGGSWSVIGAPTTTMLWIGKQITVSAAAKALFLPCLLSMILVLLVYQLRFSKKEAPAAAPLLKNDLSRSEKAMFFIGIIALLFVPVFKTVTHLPPYMGMMMSLAVVWAGSEIMNYRRDEEDKQRYSVGAALSKIEIPSLLFFLGILLAVGSLEVTGMLDNLAENLEQVLPNKTITISVIGLLSAIVDNIPLTAATMGMYDLSVFPTDNSLWLLTAYCVGTGGSILVIGSAAGVAAMGVRKSMDFFWYVRHISIWALATYLLGIFLFLLFQNL
jgi:Na+/H+ antiporter NhaD/arsenite permease-like protein